MIVLIAPEEDVENELSILTRLFEVGLQYFHLRKPHKNIEEHRQYLDLIPKEFHENVVLHYHHQLVSEYKLKGIHLQEQVRRDLRDIHSYCAGLQSKSVSSSFHEKEELQACDYTFDYHLLSPVFASISKKGYEGRGFDVNAIPKKVIGMGGVTSENLQEFTNLGFAGVGVLGGIWKHPNPVTEFQQMQSYFKNLN